MKKYFRFIGALAVIMAVGEGAGAEECASTWTEFNQLKSKPAAVNNLPAVFTVDTAFVKAGIILKRSDENLMLEMKVKSVFANKNESQKIKKICFTDSSVRVFLSASDYKVDILPGNKISLMNQTLAKTDRATFNRILSAPVTPGQGNGSSSTGGT